ncbi:MAG: hypothetical protein Q7R76_01330 [Candidatus Woesearchaeota archaeon]|nr:hypothetical protein [Candidatus Woesearchaeota archaeon]
MNVKEQKRQQPEEEPGEARLYVYAVVAIIVITGMVVILMNNGRVSDVENLDARVAKVYATAPPYSIQHVFENKTQYPPESAVYDAAR